MLNAFPSMPVNVMSGSRHLLEIYEPYDYTGRNPVGGHGAGVVQGPGGTDYFLLQLDQPVPGDSGTFEQLLLLPRYRGDAIERARDSTCTVNLCRIREGVVLEPEGKVSFEDVTHWGVGRISRLNGAS